MEKTWGHLVHPHSCTRKVAGAKQPVHVMLTRQHFSSWSGAVAHTLKWRRRANTLHRPQGNTEKHFIFIKWLAAKQKRVRIPSAGSVWRQEWGVGLGERWQNSAGGEVVLTSGKAVSAEDSVEYLAWFSRLQQFLLFLIHTKWCQLCP